MLACFEEVTSFHISGAISSATCTTCTAGTFSTRTGGLQIIRLAERKPENHLPAQARQAMTRHPHLRNCTLKELTIECCLVSGATSCDACTCPIGSYLIYCNRFGLEYEACYAGTYSSSPGGITCVPRWRLCV